MTFPNSNKRVMIVMPGENCECVCTALKEIFVFINGVPTRIVFDNATGIGRRIQKMLEMSEGFTRFRLHYGFETTFANPASGWEKGSVENAVGTLRRNLFVPVPRIADDLMEYNRAYVLQKSFEYEADVPRGQQGPHRPSRKGFHRAQDRCHEDEQCRFSAAGYEVHLQPRPGACQRAGHSREDGVLSQVP